MRDPLYPTVPADWNVVTDTGCPASLAGNSGNPATPSRCKLAAQSSASNDTDWRCYVSLVTAVVYKDASTTFVGELPLSGAVVAEAFQLLLPPGYVQVDMLQR